MSDRQRSPMVSPLLHFIFFLSGISTVLIGQVLPILARRFSLSDLQLSFFFPAQFAGSLFGTSLTMRLARRNDHVLATVLGSFAMAVGVVLMNFDSFVVCLAGFFANGMGVGLTLPSINMMIVESNPERSGPALNVLNFCWGLGAILCKPFVDAFSYSDSLGATTYLMALPLIVSAVFLAFAGKDEKKRHTAVHGAEPDNDTPIWSTPMAWAIGLFNYVHVGFESGMGGWLTTYSVRVAGDNTIHWVSPTLLYFLLFVIGRGAAPALFKLLDENKMLFLGLVITLVGMSVTLTADSLAGLGLGAAISGFGTSWIFPTNVSRFAKVFGSAATRRSTPLFLCGTLGAACVTWLIGYLSDRTGDLRSGMYVLGASILFLLILQSALALKQVISRRGPANAGTS